MQASVPVDNAESPANSGTTLEVRLSLLITALLAIVALAGGAYVVRKARDDIRDEAQSTLVLTDHFLDAEIDVLHERWVLHGFEAPLFKLHELGQIRHLSVRFYDNHGTLVESNDPGSRQPAAPAWFGAVVRLASPPLQSEVRLVRFNDVPVGRLVIAADPSYETDEMWSTSRGLLALLLAFFLLVNTLVWWAASRAMRPVERILAALGDLRRGNLTARLPQFDLPELSRISVGFNHMAATLEESVTENQRLTRRLIETQETERTSLARELHDEIGQCVSAIHADAAAIRNRGGESVRESAEAIVEVTGHIKQIVRSMLQRLRPPVLEGLGLGPALRELVGAFQHRNPQVVCSLQSSGDYTQERSNGTNCRANEVHARTAPDARLAGITLDRAGCTLEGGPTARRQAGGGPRSLARVGGNEMDGVGSPGNPNDHSKPAPEIAHSLSPHFSVSILSCMRKAVAGRCYPHFIDSVLPDSAHSRRYKFIRF